MLSSRVSMHTQSGTKCIFDFPIYLEYDINYVIILRSCVNNVMQYIFINEIHGKPNRTGFIDITIHFPINS